MTEEMDRFKVNPSRKKATSGIHAQPRAHRRALADVPTLFPFLRSCKCACPSSDACVFVIFLYICV